MVQFFKAYVGSWDYTIEGAVQQLGFWGGIGVLAMLCVLAIHVFVVGITLGLIFSQGVQQPFDKQLVFAD